MYCNGTRRRLKNEEGKKYVSQSLGFGIKNNKAGLVWVGMVGGYFKNQGALWFFLLKTSLSRQNSILNFENLIKKIIVIKT